MPSDAIQCKPLEVAVSDRGIERAIKTLKRKLASEGVLRELKMRRHYMKPSVKRRKKQAEAARRPAEPGHHVVHGGKPDVRVGQRDDDFPRAEMFVGDDVGDPVLEAFALVV